MDRNAAVKWGVAGVLVLALALGAFVGGMRVGAAIPAAMNETFLLQTRTEAVSALGAHLALLEGGSAAALREQLNVELERELFAVCTYMNDAHGAAAHDEAPRRAVHRIARYRVDHPPAFPAAWLADQTPTAQEVRRRVDACLKAALDAQAGD